MAADGVSPAMRSTVTPQVLRRRAIRLCKQRWDGAINAVARRQKRLAGRHPWSPVVFVDRVRRVLSLVSALPLRVPGRARVYFDHVGSPVGKFGIAHAELRAAGLPEERIHVGNDHRSGGRRLVRLLLRLPRATALLIGLRWQRKRWPRPETLTVLLGLDAAQRFIRRHRQLRPLIISDMNPQLIVLAAAAARSGQAIWWQDDYHHLPESLAFGSAVVLTADAAERFAQISPGGDCYRRDGQRPTSTRPLLAPQQFGVAVNGFFTGSDEQLAVLARLRSLLAAAQLQLRLHPSASLQSAALPGWLQVAPAEEPLADFARRMDMVICGDSAVQLRILSLGTPVVHVAGLDSYGGYDYYGFVRDGIVYGRQQVDAELLAEMRAFYAQPGCLERLQARMSGPVTALPPLAGLVRDMSEKELTDG